MTRTLGAILVSAVLVLVPGSAFAAIEPPANSKLLETVSVPAKTLNNEHTKTFASKLKKGRLYAVRFSGSYTTGDGISWDPAYCYAGPGCSPPSPRAVIELGFYKRVKKADPTYSHFRTWFEGGGPYPAYQSDHVYTLPFEATFLTQLRANACPYTACDDVGAFEARLFQVPFPPGFLHLWGEDCRDGERYDGTIAFSSGQCQRVVLEAESAPTELNLNIQQKRDGEWRGVPSDTVVHGALPRTSLDVRGGSGKQRYRAVLKRGENVVATSNVVKIQFLG